ncbi:hypothetical protein L7F22_005840 [Adiantum nelumboides]|nr:hypothetical protein [Adiantum nelumboides]
MASDLDEELLAAAGCTGTGKRVLIRRVKEDYQDSDPDSPEEEEEEVDNDDESDWPSSSRNNLDMASVKRRGSFEMEDENEDDDDDDSVSSLSFGEDLIGDENDRERLQELTEFQRELIFLERGEKLQEYEKRKLKRSQEKAEKARRLAMSAAVTSPSSARRASMISTSSARPRVLAGRREKAEILNNLVALKQSKTRDSALKKRKMFEAGILTPPSDGDEEDDGTQSHSINQALEDYEEVESGKSSPEAEKMAEKEMVEEEGLKDQLSFADITDITIRRSKLAKWLSEPYFEKIVVGCFVRLAVGSDSETGYCLCQVAAIEVADPSRWYKLENRTTHKYMSCAFGDKVFTASMTRVSEQPPKEEEYDAWKKVVVADLSVYKELVANKAAAIIEVGNFVYSADTVKRMLEENRNNAGRPFNLAAEKDRVARELALAEHEQPCDISKVAQLQAQLKQLQAMGAERGGRDAKAIALAEMNRRNREENFRNASQKRSLDGGQGGYDPFSRRWTRSQNYYSKAPAPIPAVAPSDAMPTQSELLPTPVPVSEEAAQKEAAESGKLVNTGPPSNQVVQLHRFELPLDLSRLQKFGSGPAGVALAYLSNRQRLESVFEHPENKHDPNAHPHTLSINDYKRRMNLID